jgi:hypothetical protein
MRETVSVKDYGAVGDGVANDTTAFVNALNYLASRHVPGSVGGDALYVPQGLYKITQALALPLTITIYGDGPVSSRLLFTGTNSHGITMLNPINSSTQTFNRIESLSIIGPGRTVATGFGVYDRGGTEWVLRDCFIAEWKYGVILDQSEIVTIETCDIAGCGVAGIWLVNGPDLTAGEGGGFTNRITIRECQFNGCGEYSIVDDGGVDHVIRDNNYNYATAAHLRAAGVSTLLVQGGEWEGAPINVFLTTATRPGASTLRPEATGVGQSGSVCLQSNTFTQPLGTAAVFIPGGVAALTLLSNGFGNMGKAEALVKGVVNVAYLFTAGNTFYEHTNNNPGATFLDGKALIHNVMEATFEGSAVADVGSLAAGASGFVNVAVGGAVVGDYVESVSAAPDLGDNFEVTGRVSGAGTVRVRVRNTSTATADPASATFRVRIRRQNM